MAEINFYNIDCIEFMKTKPDKYYDLAIVDPPYGINMDGGKIGGNNCGKAKDYTQKNWDKEPPSIEYFKELMRVSKNQIIWGANHFISRMPFDSSCWIIWDKDNSGNFADCEMAWTSFNTAVRKYKFRWNGMLQQNMKDKEIRIHPTQKPKDLYRWILKNYAKPNDLILDTHGGSMSISIACDMEGFDLDVTEIDTEYFINGQKRYEQYKQQPQLF
jgi:site-specific DNA-methyltransferase (adenine-specific)